MLTLPIAKVCFCQRQGKEGTINECIFVEVDDRDKECFDPADHEMFTFGVHRQVVYDRLLDIEKAKCRPKKGISITNLNLNEIFLRI